MVFADPFARPIAVPFPPEVETGSDSDLLTFVAQTGATDTNGISDIISYVKSEGFWDNFVIYPMKSAQNAGSGTTVYGLGGLTGNNVSLYGDDSWALGGMAFGQDDYGDVTIPSLATADEVLLLLRIVPSTESLADSTRCVFFSIGNFRSTTPIGTAGVTIGGATSATSGETWSATYTYDADTNDPRRRVGTSNLTWTAAEDFTKVVQLGNDFSLWKNKSLITMDKLNGVDTTTDCAPVDLGTTGGLLTIAGGKINGSVSQSSTNHGSVVAVALLCGTAQVSSSQRESLTDLINAL